MCTTTKGVILALKTFWFFSLQGYYTKLLHPSYLRLSFALPSLLLRSRNGTWKGFTTALQRRYNGLRVKAKSDGYWLLIIPLSKYKLLLHLNLCHTFSSMFMLRQKLMLINLIFLIWIWALEEKWVILLRILRKRNRIQQHWWFLC